MTEGDSKEGRGKAKDALLDWVRKKTTGYVHTLIECEILLFRVNFSL